MTQYIAESSSSLHGLLTTALVDTQKYYCPFLERGFCREQSRCNFSHDCHLSTRIPTDYCHFYLANQCLYGQDCKFLHTEPELAEVQQEILADDAIVEQIAAGSTRYTSIGSGGGSDCFGDGDDDDEVADEYADAHDEEDLKPHDKVEGDSSVERKGTLASQGLARLAGPAADSHGFMYNSETGGSANTNEPSHTPAWQDANSASTDQPNDSTPALSSSRLKGSRISHRCAMVAPSSSSASSSSSTSLATATLLAKLHQAVPQSSSHVISAVQISANSNAQFKSESSTANTSSSSSSGPSAKGAWQNTRLIASIRNNLVESNTAASGSASGEPATASNTTEADLPLCPYSLTSGECPFSEGRCTYLHGDVCDLCYSACLHPYNERQRHQHREECLREHEREMELSFAVQRSKDKVCGICMDTVVEKKPITSSRFGILEKCNHIFCLDCIRKWRGTKQFDSRTIRACPECRVSSDFVVPSKYWVEEQEDKDKLITDYKSALRAKPCRYFKEGKGECPFAGSCFYKHAYPDGSLAVLDAPKPRRRLYGARGPTTSVANYILWNILTSTDEDDLSINEDLQSLYDLDEMYNIEHSDIDDEPAWP